MRADQVPNRPVTGSRSRSGIAGTFVNIDVQVGSRGLHDRRFEDFNPAALGVVEGSCLKLHDDLPAGIRRNSELLNDGDVVPTGFGHDVIVGEHLRPVERHVELALPGGAVVGLGKVQTHEVIGAGN